MSWSVSFLGKPDKVVEALELESTKQTGQCKIEYDDANGSGYALNGEQKNTLRY